MWGKVLFSLKWFNVDANQFACLFRNLQETEFMTNICNMVSFLCLFQITKSVMEKKRRARINTSLTELKSMLAGMITEKVRFPNTSVYLRIHPS